MIKIVVMFLMLMLVLSMVGNLVSKFMGTKPPAAKAQTKAICASCGRTVLGTAPCICGKG